MDARFRVEFTPAIEQYRSFFSYSVMRRIRWLIVFVIIELIWFCLFLLFPEPRTMPWVDRLKEGWSLLVLPLIWFLARPIYFLSTTRKRWNNSLELREARIIEFSDGGITETAQNCHISMTWQCWVRAVTTGNLIIVYTGQAFGLIIPCSAIGDANAIESFKTFLKTKVADCSRLK